MPPVRKTTSWLMNVSYAELMVVNVWSDARVQFLQMLEESAREYVVCPVFVHCSHAAVTQVPVVRNGRSRPRRCLMSAVSPAKPQCLRQCVVWISVFDLNLKL